MTCHLSLTMMTRFSVHPTRDLLNCQRKRNKRLLIDKEIALWHCFISQWQRQSSMLPLHRHHSTARCVSSPPFCLFFSFPDVPPSHSLVSSPLLIPSFLSCFYPSLPFSFSLAPSLIFCSPPHVFSYSLISFCIFSFSSPLFFPSCSPSRSSFSSHILFFSLGLIFRSPSRVFYYLLFSLLFFGSPAAVISSFVSQKDIHKRKLDSLSDEDDSDQVAMSAGNIRHEDILSDEDESLQANMSEDAIRQRAREDGIDLDSLSDEAKARRIFAIRFVERLPRSQK